MELIQVKVFNDMGHINYTPNLLPEYVVTQIRKDVKAIYPVVFGDTIRVYKLLPNVSSKRRINQFIINYEIERMKPEELPVATYIPGNHFLCVVDNLFTPDECKNLIKIADGVKNSGYNKAWHPADTGGIYMRVMMIDRQLANSLWDKIKPFLPKDLKFKGYKLVYLNDHFRFSRYRKGGKFHLHCDGKNYDASRPEESEGYSTESLFTLNIFLNDGFEGGETDFFESGKGTDINLRQSVKPKAGRGALFWADQYHQGNVVMPTDAAEYKYLLRTDVMGV
jgi:hypothetical protein